MLLFCRALLAGKMTKIAQSCVRRRGPSQGKEDTNAKRNPPNLTGLCMAILQHFARSESGSIHL